MDNGVHVPDFGLPVSATGNSMTNFGDSIFAINNRRLAGIDLRFANGVGKHRVANVSLLIWKGRSILADSRGQVAISMNNQGRSRHERAKTPMISSQTLVASPATPSPHKSARRASRPFWPALLAALMLTAFVSELRPALAAPGDITTVAGNGTAGFSGDNQLATAAQLNNPLNVAVDGSGNLFIVDFSNNRIRKVDGNGTITTVAGTGTAGFNGDNQSATAAQLNQPRGVAVDGSGNLFIADSYNNRIRKVDGNGTITTVAGIGTQGSNGDNQSATAAQLYQPVGVTVDGSGNLFIADSFNSRIRKVNSAGIITTIAGGGNQPVSDGVVATTVQLANPAGVAVDNNGNVFIADTNRHSIRKVDSNGIITTVAGNDTQGFNGDNQPATAAQLFFPESVVVDGRGNLFIADSGNNRVRKVDGNGIITTVVGTGVGGFNGDNQLATTAQINYPYGIAIDGSGNLFISDINNNRIREVSPVAPIANDVSGETVTGKPVGLVLSSDTPGATYEITSGPGNGTAVVAVNSDGQTRLFYRSNSGFSGTDTVKFVAIAPDGTRSQPATAAIIINFNDVPFADPVNGNVASGVLFVATLTGSDHDDNDAPPVKFGLVTLPAHGTASIAKGSDGVSRLYYRSNNGYVGTDTFQFRAVDNQGAYSDPATATIQVTSNAAPTTQDVSGSVQSDKLLALKLSGTDPDGSIAAYKIARQPLHGRAALSRGSDGVFVLFYRSDAGYVGSDSIGFVAIGSKGARSAVANAAITVTAPPQSDAAGTSGGHS